ncbi:MAG: hypothetical protein N4A48_11915 [Tepidibacter sp.]|jgi:hypothetical protein|uniref:pilus assembly PilX family protein n=1 Tax=Tepidibacter sp. TaxID=2529387 RepID=UPI0025E35C4E|nr:pilus assembly PilX N-terminal domain-containing protein [Tepidibacter sp.]MCT4509436.1 hypothetical protein [Tepidibacter sp.]
MIKKLLKSQTGSTLIMVLMTLSVLSILGTAAMSLGVMNLKMKMVDTKQKTSFYLSEAGIEEAYAIMMKKVEAGIKKGNVEVEKELPKFIQDERSKQFDEELDYKSPYLNADGSVDEERIKPKLQEWFREGYAKYLNEGYKDSKNPTKNEESLMNEIKLSSYTVLDTNVDKNGANVSIVEDESSKFPKKNEGLTDDSKFIITIVSEFNHKKIKKNIKSTFSINIPKYNTPYYIGNDVFKLKENVLWTKALIADKNIVIQGNDVAVNGDIYAYGDLTKKNIEQRGILVGLNNKSGNLTVEGNVSTGGYLKTSENNSNITVKKGDVYCNSLVIPQGKSNCNIKIEKGNVNTYDDIELNGEKSKINIDGNYYGFSYGSRGHDESSSIIINSEDIGKTNGSSITITGNGESKKYYGNGQDDGKGNFIAGTVYIDLDNDVDYQTGESISVKGNYIGYSKKLESQSVRLSDGKDYYEKDINFQYISPLYLMNKINGSNRPIYEQRGKYLKAIYDKDNSILNLGEGGINIKNIKYSLGGYIKNEKTGSELESGIFDISHINYFDINLKEYEYHINTMADPQIDNYSNLDNKVDIDYWFNFSNINEVNNDEIFYSNNDSNKKISIIGPNANNPDKSGDFVEIKNLDGKSRGIIVTKGDVYIYGKIDFKGIIVTKGNIYIQDDNPKEFTNDYKTNFEGNYAIHEIIKHINDKGTNKIGDLFKQKPSWSKETQSIVDNSDAGVDNNVQTHYKFFNLIDITKWQQSK